MRFLRQANRLLFGIVLLILIMRAAHDVGDGEEDKEGPAKENHDQKASSSSHKKDPVKVEKGKMYHVLMGRPGSSKTMTKLMRLDLLRVNETRLKASASLHTHKPNMPHKCLSSSPRNATPPLGLPLP